MSNVSYIFSMHQFFLQKFFWQKDSSLTLSLPSLRWYSLSKYITAWVPPNYDVSCANLSCSELYLFDTFIFKVSIKLSEITFSKFLCKRMFLDVSTLPLHLNDIYDNDVLKHKIITVLSIISKILFIGGNNSQARQKPLHKAILQYSHCNMVLELHNHLHRVCRP